MTVKQLQFSPSLTNLQAACLLKKELNCTFFCELYEAFKNTFSIAHLR